MSAEAKLRIRKIATHMLCAALFIGACGGAFHVSQKYVDRIARTPTPPTVVLKDQPVWMSQALAEQILASVRPATPFAPNDHQMLADRALILGSNPWVKSVHAVRRQYVNAPGDTIEIDCEFRAPVALVKWQDAYWYVDADAVRLPERLSGEQVAQLIRPGISPMFHIIDGVGSAPLPPGKAWPGGDVKAGIELIALLANKPYGDQIIKIDVSNFGGRVNANESQLNLITRYGTEVRWGQAPSSKAFFVEQNVDRKLDYLSQARKQTGRVDMNQAWIDLRFDNPTVPDNRPRAAITP
ncbi:MAG: hypothetical protein H7144_14540 [Burkholderiales bacterium]|nr:hypothetical protein [Phycisphaerae bacterium]